MIPPFFNIFSENKIRKPRKNKKRNTLKKIPKKVTFGISVQQIGSFTNEQDCLQELKKPENKGGKCRLISVGSYTIEKEIRVKR